MDAPGVESRTVELDSADGRRRRTESDVQYLVAGEGPPVVLLHGIGLDSATVSWRHAVPALAEDHRVYAPDFPGHGESGRPRVRYTTDYFRDVLAAFLEELDLAGAPLVGISMGGGVALGYALEHDVDRLVLVDSYGLGRDAPWRPAASAMLRVPGAYSNWWRAIGSSRVAVRTHLQQLTAGHPRKDLVDDVYEAVQDGAVGRTVASWQRSEFRCGGLRTCYLDRLDEIGAPTLFVHGERDPLLPASWSERAAERTGAELALFEACGHWPTRECPERFNERVARFL
ncbi:alpha/beta fold hydrolase [Natronomonas salina]|uniref:alpha/beta fold hydrolase n=1 Tax=Natronomonas salina TaxID=1710540 RepID=UPI0015B5CEFF|nr:alpha/beta fold hydrolase [Natronomonas salina]QLD89774.1 alpha/beta fold hydrolase [Natronomonas salina]